MKESLCIVENLFPVALAGRTSGYMSLVVLMVTSPTDHWSEMPATAETAGRRMHSGLGHGCVSAVTGTSASGRLTDVLPPVVPGRFDLTPLLFCQRETIYSTGI